MTANYTQSELLNEVSKIFRAQIDPGREGGTLNTRTEYEQLLELSSVTFLLHNDAIFYLAFLARNRLYRLLTSEAALIEDMLVALNDLSQIGQVVRDTTTLSNANTALLALDSAGSVKDRPETQRFMDMMDKFASEFRGNVVSKTTGVMVRPREDARNVLKVDLGRLKDLHQELLTSTFALRDLLSNFISLDIPSKVAATTISSIRSNLESMSNKLVTTDTATNIANSRKNVLTALASKTAVGIMSQFTDPRDLKVRSPINPIPSNISHLGRVAGNGDPASVMSGPGPWTLPVSEALVLSANGAAPSTVALDTILGATLNGRTAGDFYIDASQQNLHVVVDPTVRTLPLTAGTGLSTVVSTTFAPLGFKHLGALLSFPTPSVAQAPTEPQYRNLSPRLITEHRLLQGFTVDAFDSSTGIVTLRLPTAGDEGGVGLRDDHVGSYLKQNVSGQDRRWEILEVVHPVPPVPSRWYAVLSVPEVNSPPAVTPQVGSTCELRGQSTVAGGTKFAFAVAHGTTAPTGNVIIGPAVKTAQFTSSGTRTLAQIISDIRNNQGDYNAFYTGDVSQALNQHIQVSEAAGQPGCLALTIRSKQGPYIKIVDRFLKVSNTSPQPTPPIEVSTVLASAHSILGFRIGESDTTNVLTPFELASWVNAVPGSGLQAEVVTTDLLLGEDLTLTPVVDPAEVVHPTIDFANYAEAGDQIELITEDPATSGVFQIVTVDGSRLVLDRAPFPSASSVAFRLFREQVRLSTTRRDRGCSLEVVSGPFELGFSEGTYYGSIPAFEAVDEHGGLWSFSGISPGDLLRVVGYAPVSVANVTGTRLTLETGMPSNVEELPFEIQSVASKRYLQLQGELEMFTSSGVLLKNHHYDENLDELDAVMTSALLPGQNFSSNRNRARQYLLDLLALLTSQMLRSDEHGVSLPSVDMNLEEVLTPYEVSAVPALNSVIDAFLDRKYHRAVDLLRSAQLLEFYDTNEETGSFSGAVVSASRTVVEDLPKSSTSAYDVETGMNVASKFQEVADAESNFNDTESHGDFSREY